MHGSAFLLPVLILIVGKLIKANSKSFVVEGTFCFRPRHKLRFNRKNCLAMAGLLLEFFQYSFFCFPSHAMCGITACTGSHMNYRELSAVSTLLCPRHGSTQSAALPPLSMTMTLAEYTIVPYKLMYWIATSGALAASCIIIVNSTLTGKHPGTALEDYPSSVNSTPPDTPSILRPLTPIPPGKRKRAFSRNLWVWFIYKEICSTFFVTITTGQYVINQHIISA